MRPFVIDMLLSDLMCYGYCAHTVVDNYHEFSIKRITPEVLFDNSKRRHTYVRF